MNNLLINKKSASDINNFIASPAHALLLVGEKGSGKKSIAHSISSALLKIPTSKLSTHPYFLEVKPLKEAVLIDDIRALIASLSLKTTGPELIRRVAYIENANTMTNEAQTALLKAIEEPPSDSVIILSTVSVESLLGTIISRVQQINVLPVSKQDAAEYLKNKDIETEDFDKNFLLSEGMASTFLSLQTNNDLAKNDIEVLNAAKNIFKIGMVERLAMVDELAKDKNALESLLNAFRKIARAAQRQAIDNHNHMLALRLLNVQESANLARSMLLKNANPKLTLMHLMLNI